MKYALGAMSGVVLAAGAVHATTFSFASDTDPSSHTWRGFSTAMGNAQDPGDPVTLTVDDGNGPGAPITFDVEFRAAFALTPNGLPLNLGGGRFLHTYNVGGPQGGPATFGFFLPGNVPLLTATFTGGSMSSLGSAGAWGTVGGVQATDVVGQVTYTWNGPNLPAYGLFTGQSSIGVDDAAFTLSDLHTLAGPGVPMNDVNLPAAEWFAEGSFSGTANFVPAPGALALLGLGSFALARRRR